MDVKAMLSPSANIQELISAGLAPALAAALKTITPELVKPTRTAMKPADIFEKEKYLVKIIPYSLSSHPIILA